MAGPYPQVATDSWVADRVHHYAHLGVDPVEAFTDPIAYAATTGRRVSRNCWGSRLGFRPVSGRADITG